MPVVHAIRTGVVRVRRAQMEGQGKGLARMAAMLFDDEWTPWAPIYAWLIEHEEGLILVDTGETARVHESGYHPRWHPFYRRAAEFSVHPDEEIGPQLRARGFSPRDVRTVVVTHLHTDHAGGLAHVTGSRILVSADELLRASGFGGRLQGYLPNRWPKFWKPEPIRFTDDPIGPFAETMTLTARGDVTILPTPGHTPHHVSVLVSGSPSYFVAGDTSYTQDLLVAGKVDGVSPDPGVALATINRIKALAADRPLVYLPSHDPESEDRLARNTVLTAEAGSTTAAAADASPVRTHTRF